MLERQLPLLGEDVVAMLERSLGQIQRELSEIAGVDHSDKAVADLPSPRMPPRVTALFTEAQSTLDQFDTTFRAAAEVGSRNAVDAQAAVRGRLSSPQVFSVVGVAAMLRTLLNTFQDGVNDWYWLYVLNSSGQPYQEDKDRLSALCRAYDAVFEYVPFFRLEQLAGLEPHLVDSDAPPTPQVGEAQEVISHLSAQVQAAVLESVAERL
ncbi:hypothetical protein SK854_34920 [Lentzea sp. BCCO 10_0061]|uniref:Uncharacterized protein n=1 Tax=Lentzea sokolovensis TaxID=3095429 RepID=A0ABU4V7K5_9PSEU|nr:hypothetical protein [Lentzea sp. BCCO 10_0061]MDX8147347.1 hypothetical protein [Lentzea sp. BCCO 10_0061]